MFKALSFDCYGTLIDWGAGLASELRAVGVPEESIPAVLERRAFVEWRLEQNSPEFLTYREIVERSVFEACCDHGVPVTQEHAHQVARSIGRWPAFEDSIDALDRLSRKFRLAVASNVDHVDIETTAQLLQVEFDVVVTAEDVKSYKPSPAHFERLIAELDLPKDQVLHVSAYPSYDLRTSHSLGIPYAYVDRLSRKLSGDLKPAYSTPTLARLADLLEPQ